MDRNALKLVNFAVCEKVRHRQSEDGKLTTNLVGVLASGSIPHSDVVPFSVFASVKADRGRWPIKLSVSPIGGQSESRIDQLVEVTFSGPDEVRDLVFSYSIHPEPNTKHRVVLSCDGSTMHTWTLEIGAKKAE